jgi:hypothetical protein
LFLARFIRNWRRFDTPFFGFKSPPSHPSFLPCAPQLELSGVRFVDITERACRAAASPVWM